jgi:hypothetical protein
VQLRSLDGVAILSCKIEAPIEIQDPDESYMIPLHHHLLMKMPAPGRYEVVMLANGVEAASDLLLADLEKVEDSES